MGMEALKTRICEMQEDLDKLAACRDDITSDDVLKLSMQLDDLIVEYTKISNTINV